MHSLGHGYVAAHLVRVAHHALAPLHPEELRDPVQGRAGLQDELLVQYRQAALRADLLALLVQLLDRAAPLGQYVSVGGDVVPCSILGLTEISRVL